MTWVSTGKCFAIWRKAFCALTLFFNGQKTEGDGVLLCPCTDTVEVIKRNASSQSSLLSFGLPSLLSVSISLMSGHIAGGPTLELNQRGLGLFVAVWPGWGCLRTAATRPQRGVGGKRRQTHRDPQSLLCLQTSPLIAQRLSAQTDMEPFTFRSASSSNLIYLSRRPLGSLTGG